MIPRSAIACACVGGLTLTAAVGSAQERNPEALGGARKAYESPQHFAVELRFAPFKPDVDSDPALNGQTPFANTFGTGAQLLVTAEFDWQAYRIPHFGTIGPGAGAGYTTTSANARFTVPHNNQTISGEKTSLDIFPIYVVAVLRADVLWREIGIPLVPYAKAGVGYSLWRASNVLGTSSYLGVSGEGHSMGTHLALGVGFNLNVLDPYAARDFDESMGVNGTYLFAEWAREDLTGLGLQKSPLRVGGTSWNFGLALEF